MSRRLVWTIAFVLLLVALLAPAAESFDCWDHGGGLAGDSELPLAALALMMGLVAVVALAVARLGSPLVAVRLPRPAAVTDRFSGSRRLVSGSSSPPPLLMLRI